MPALADDDFLFFGAVRENFMKVVQMSESFATASGLKINMYKSVLASCTERSLDDLGWTRVVVQRGMIC